MDSNTAKLVAAIICFVLFLILIVLAAIFDDQDEMRMSFCAMGAGLFLLVGLALVLSLIL